MAMELELAVSQKLLTLGGFPYTAPRLIGAAQQQRARHAVNRIEAAILAKPADAAVLEVELDEAMAVLQEPLTLGRVLIDLLATMQGVAPAKALIANRISGRIMDTIENGETYKAGEIAVGIMREALEQNHAGFPLRVIALAAEALGIEAGGEL